MIIKNKVKPRTPAVEPGVYPAVCVGVVDLGEQFSEKFKTYSNKIRIVWALPGETIEAWMGTKFSDEAFESIDLFSLIGRACFLNVVLNGTGEYADIDTVIPLPKGTTPPVSTTAPITWDMEEWSDEGFAALPEWAQDEIKKSTQYQETHVPVTDVQIQTAAASGQPLTVSTQAPTMATQAPTQQPGPVYQVPQNQPQQTAQAAAGREYTVQPGDSTTVIQAGARGGLPF